MMNAITPNKKITLQVDRLLDYHDVPQLFTARDDFDTLYICLLYEDCPVCKYIAIRLSRLKFQAFLAGDIDLRELFTSPETENEYFDVAFDNEVYHVCSMPQGPLPEEMLPEEGYKLSESDKESIIVNIPTRDRGLLLELIRKFGWACM